MLPSARAVPEPWVVARPRDTFSSPRERQAPFPQYAATAADAESAGRRSPGGSRVTSARGQPVVPTIANATGVDGVGPLDSAPVPGPAGIADGRRPPSSPMAPSATSATTTAATRGSAHRDTAARRARRPGLATSSRTSRSTASASGRGRSGGSRRVIAHLRGGVVDPVLTEGRGVEQAGEVAAGAEEPGLQGGDRDPEHRRRLLQRALRPHDELYRLALVGQDPGQRPTHLTHRPFVVHPGRGRLRVVRRRCRGGVREVGDESQSTPGPPAVVAALVPGRHEQVGPRRRQLERIEPPVTRSTPDRREGRPHDLLRRRPRRQPAKGEGVDRCRVSAEQPLQPELGPRAQQGPVGPVVAPDHGPHALPLHFRHPHTLKVSGTAGPVAAARRGTRPRRRAATGIRRRAATAYGRAPLPVAVGPCVVRGDAVAAEAASGHLVILVTRPAPTVRPPSRMANLRPSSMAMGWMSSTDISVLSPGITISVPSGSFTTPVTSVVRK